MKKYFSIATALRLRTGKTKPIFLHYLFETCKIIAINDYTNIFTKPFS